MLALSRRRLGMRAAVLSALLAFALPAAGNAQAPPAAAESVSPQALAAGRDMAQAILIDSGALDAILDLFAAHVLPELRESIVITPLYRDASSEHRAALVAFVNGLPDLLRTEIRAEFGTLRERAAPRFAARLTVEEMDQIAAFMRSPDLRERWGQLAKLAASPEGEAPPFPQWRDLAFAQTPAGLALAREEDALAQILDEE